MWMLILVMIGAVAMAMVKKVTMDKKIQVERPEEIAKKANQAMNAVRLERSIRNKAAKKRRTPLLILDMTEEEYDIWVKNKSDETALVRRHMTVCQYKAYLLEEKRQEQEELEEVANARGMTVKAYLGYQNNKAKEEQSAKEVAEMRANLLYDMM